MKQRYFGTDGIRGEVGKGHITADFILRSGWALATWLRKQQKRPRVLIGKDTRISGYMFESALQAGIAAAGADVALLKSIPTPAVAYLTRSMNAQAGIVISASHNPYDHNGIKLFSGQGIKLDDADENEIERLIDHPMTWVATENIGKVKRIDDGIGRYIEFCKNRVERDFNLRGVNIVIDCANGATYHCAPLIFEELGAEVTALNVQPDGLNINQDCGATSPQALVAAVNAHRADLGIAFDGDGDRLMMVDDQGEILDGDDILYLIARHLHQQNQLGAGVVGTLHSNYGLEQAVHALGVSFLRTPVGDRHVGEALRNHNWYLGGESSGHIVCRHDSTTGDGILSALQVLEAQWRTKQPLSELRKGLKKLPIAGYAFHYEGDRKRILAQQVVTGAIQKAEQALVDNGRVLVRASGTEPVIRIHVECVSLDLAEQWCDGIRKAIQSAI